jgi:hypothetical protein
VLSLALASCATPSASPPPAVEQPKPKATDVRICAEVRKADDLPAGASLPQAVTPAERAGLSLFLTWVASVVDHDKGMTERAELARRETCPS